MKRNIGKREVGSNNNMKKRKLTITILIITAGIALFIIGYIMLPQNLVMQITSSGQDANIMPKPIGLLIPLAVNVIFAVFYYKKEEAQTKYLLLSLLGFAVYALTFIFNLK